MDDNKYEPKLTADALKIIATILMLIDHIAYSFLHRYLTIYYMDILPQTYTKLNNIYECMRGVGRIAFPIFCFFLVEGFLKTRNHKKHLIRLACFALLSEVPFDLGLYGKVFYNNHQNVILTLLLGYIMLLIIRYFDEKIPGLNSIEKYICIICSVFGFADLSFILKTDYNYKGIILIATLYILRSTKALKLLSGAAVMSLEKYAPASFLLLYFYNPAIKPKLKYFFYLFYPLHLLALYLIGFLLFR